MSSHRGNVPPDLASRTDRPARMLVCEPSEKGFEADENWFQVASTQVGSSSDANYFHPPSPKPLGDYLMEGNESLDSLFGELPVPEMTDLPLVHSMSLAGTSTDFFSAPISTTGDLTESMHIAFEDQPPVVSVRLEPRVETGLPHTEHRESAMEVGFLDRAGRKRRRKISAAAKEAGSYAGEHEVIEEQTYARSRKARGNASSSPSVTLDRRGRNRDAARRVRERRQQALHTLQAEIGALAEQNDGLTSQLQEVMAVLESTNKLNLTMRELLRSLDPSQLRQAGNAAAEQLCRAMHHLVGPPHAARQNVEPIIALDAAGSTQQPTSQEQHGDAGYSHGTDGHGLLELALAIDEQDAAEAYERQQSEWQTATDRALNPSDWLSAEGQQTTMGAENAPVPISLPIAALPKQGLTACQAAVAQEPSHRPASNNSGSASVATGAELRVLSKVAEKSASVETAAAAVDEASGGRLEAPTTTTIKIPPDAGCSIATGKAGLTAAQMSQLGSLCQTTGGAQPRLCLPPLRRVAAEGTDKMVWEAFHEGIWQPVEQTPWSTLTVPAKLQQRPATGSSDTAPHPKPPAAAC